MSKVFNGRWEIVRSLGEGGQSWVYEVRDLGGNASDRAVLKRLKNHARLGRFEREVRAANALDHPSIPRVLDYSLSEPAFYVYPFVEAQTLRELGPLSPLRALDLFDQICEPVIHAHDKGVIHRDIKPDNVLVSESGRVLILDFGLCYLSDEDRLTETMEQVGSRFYMAPELEAGRADSVSETADVYALGKVLYFIVAGRDLAREDFTGDQDVARVCKNPQLEYLTSEVFPFSITADPNKRVSATALRERARTVRRLIDEHFYPGREGSRCRFCGLGTYRPLPQRKIRVREPTLEISRAFESVMCNHCGNVQWFTPAG